MTNTDSTDNMDSTTALLFICFECDVLGRHEWMMTGDADEVRRYIAGREAELQPETMLYAVPIIAGMYAINHG